MSTLHVACASSALYLPHSAAMLHSVLAHRGPHPVHIHYLQGPALPADAAGRLQGMVEAAGGRISFVSVPDETLAGLGVRPERMPPWYRVVLTELLPDLDRVLYLDVDTIAMDSLGPLWTIPLEGCCVGAVTNVLPPEHAGRARRLGLARADSYFNSGVLLFDLEAMRRTGCAERLRTYALAHGPRLLWADQDVLSVVLEDRRLHLHPRWNCMNALFSFPWAEDIFGATALEEARTSPGIRHFEGPSHCKPWHYRFAFDGAELYREHRRQTPWPRVRPEGVTPLNVARRAARVVRRRTGAV
jgi:lipopolysaccharide biosynthesis glycosyltransferase